MGKQIFKCVVVIALIIGVVGCASYPPTIILPDKATNFEYQYSVDIPQGWDASEKIPKGFEYSIPQASRKMMSLLMVNKDSKGVIILVNVKQRISYQKLIDAPLHKIHEGPQAFKIEAEKWGELSRYDSHVYVRNLFATNSNYIANPSSYKPEPIIEIEADVDMTMKDATLGIDWFTYPCHRKNSCYMGVMLVTEKDKFDNNRPAFDSVVESLTMHDIPEG